MSDIHAYRDAISKDCRIGVCSINNCLYPYCTEEKRVMWTKKNALDEAARGEGCLGKARDDEPVFIVVGDDVTMPHVLRDWAMRVKQIALNRGEPVPAKVDEAYRFANEVAVYQHNRDTVKLPD
jgi:hypothetical protein